MRLSGTPKPETFKAKPKSGFKGSTLGNPLHDLLCVSSINYTDQHLI